MKKQTISLLFSNGINFLVNFSVAPMLARTLSFKDNATIGQLNLINGYTTIIFGLGIASVINILLVENKQRERASISSIFIIQIISSIICLISFYFGAQQISSLFNNPDLGYYLILNLPGTFFILLTSFFSYYYIYFQKAHKLSVYTIALNVIKVASIYYAIHELKSLFYVIVFLNACNLLQFLVYTFGIRKQIFPFIRPKMSGIIYTLRLSLPYLGMSIVGISILFINGIIVSNRLGAKEFAIYNYGAIEIPFFASIYALITSMAMPRIVELTKRMQVEELMDLKRKISNTVATIIYPVVFFCLVNGKVFMELYLGEKFVQSGVVFSIYNIAVLIRISTYSDVLTIMKKPNSIFISNLVAFGISLITSLILITTIGVTGAALSFVVSIAILSSILIYKSCKELKIPFHKYFDFRHLAKISLLSISFSLLAAMVITANLVSFLLIGGIYMVCVYSIFIKTGLIQTHFLPGRVQKIITKMNLRWSAG